jgi:hypothetical protein
LGDGLPPAISPHNNYFLWGPQAHDGSVVIQLVKDPATLAPFYGDVSVVDRIENPYAMPQETNLMVVVCRDPKESLIDYWPKLKNYN